MREPVRITEIVKATIVPPPAMIVEPVERHDGVVTRHEVAGGMTTGWLPVRPIRGGAQDHSSCPMSYQDC